MKQKGKPSKLMQLHWKQIFQIPVKRKAISSYEKVQYFYCKDTLYWCSAGYPDCTNLRHCLPSNSCMIRLKTKVKKFDSLPCKDINT